MEEVIDEDGIILVELSEEEVEDLNKRINQE